MVSFHSCAGPLNCKLSPLMCLTFLKCWSLSSSPPQRWTDTTTLSTSTTAGWSCSSVRIHQRQRTTNQQSFTGSWTKWATSATTARWMALFTCHSLDCSSCLPLFCRPQVCDKEWHHYVLNVEFPTVSLFVDGTTFEPFLVTEDYPLHPSKIETQLTIGACWQGKPMQTCLGFCRPKWVIVFLFDGVFIPKCVRSRRKMLRLILPFLSTGK